MSKSKILVPKRPAAQAQRKLGPFRTSDAACVGVYGVCRARQANKTLLGLGALGFRIQALSPTP